MPVPLLTTNASGAGTLMVSYPKQLGTAVGYTLTVQNGATVGGMPVQQYQVAAVLAGWQDDLADFSAPPRMFSREVFVAEGDTTPTVSWAAAGSFAGALGGLAIMDWETGSSTWQWIGILPPTAATSIHFPSLPDALAIDRASAGQAFTSGSVAYVQGSIFSGPADLRANWWQILAPSSSTYTDHITGMQ